MYTMIFVRLPETPVRAASANPVTKQNENVCRENHDVNQIRDDISRQPCVLYLHHGQAHDKSEQQREGTLDEEHVRAQGQIPRRHGDPYITNSESTEIICAAWPKNIPRRFCNHSPPILVTPPPGLIPIGSSAATNKISETQFAWLLLVNVAPRSLRKFWKNKYRCA